MSRFGKLRSRLVTEAEEVGDFRAVRDIDGEGHGFYAAVKGFEPEPELDYILKATEPVDVKVRIDLPKPHARRIERDAEGNAVAIVPDDTEAVELPGIRVTKAKDDVKTTDARAAFAAEAVVELAKALKLQTGPERQAALTEAAASLASRYQLPEYMVAGFLAEVLDLPELQELLAEADATPTGGAPNPDLRKHAAGSSGAFRSLRTEDAPNEDEALRKADSVFRGVFTSRMRAWKRQTR
jgi:hypothetical protein